MHFIYYHNAHEEHPNAQHDISVVDSLNRVGSDVTEKLAAANLATKSVGVKCV